MYFKFYCPKCDKALKVRSELSGRAVRCPYCKGSVTVPAPESQPPQEEELVAPGLPRINAGPDIHAGRSVGAAARSAPAAATPQPAPRPRRQPARKPSPATGAIGACSVTTDVNMLASAGMGLAFTVAFYAAVFPIAGTYFADLFLERGGVPYVLVFLLGWSGAILLLKVFKLRRQRASMLFDLLPEDLALEITQKNLDEFVENLNTLRREADQSFLINRVRRGLEHFRVRKSASEVTGMLASQSEIDISNVDSSYTLLNVFIWAIPILGFIGTVIGISEAVGGFSGSLEQAADIDVLKQSLGSVTGGLATAFDTTLIALVMSMIVMFPTSSLRKSEEDLLTWVDEYCNENLLKRLNDGREGGAERGIGVSQAAVEKAINAAMVPHHAELEAWNRKLETIGDVLSDRVAKGWNEINQRLQEQQFARLEEFRAMDELASKLSGNTKTWSEKLERIGDVLSDRVAEGWSDISRKLQQQQEARLEELRTMDDLAGRLKASLEETVGKAESLRGDTDQSIRRSTESLQSHFDGVERGLRGLNDVLEKLGQRQVVIEMQRPQRFAWLFGRRNGE